jgi:DNA-directed RNA polymerase subunit K/omega
MNYKNSQAARTTQTRNTKELTKNTDNIYESINIISRRADQITTDMSEELKGKLEEFASSTDNLEEVFENREQIEISKFYEKLPKPHSIAVDEFINDRVYYRHRDEK